MQSMTRTFGLSPHVKHWNTFFSSIVKTFMKKSLHAIRQVFQLKISFSLIPYLFVHFELWALRYPRIVVPVLKKSLAKSDSRLTDTNWQVYPNRPLFCLTKLLLWPFFFRYCVQCKLSWQSFAILLFMDVLLPFWKCRWLPLTQYLYLVKFCAKDSGQRLFRGEQSGRKCGVGSRNFYHQIRWIPKIITEFGERVCTIFHVSIVSKKDSPKWSRYLSPNLVIHKTHPQIWWKKCTFLIYFCFLRIKSPKWSRCLSPNLVKKIALFKSIFVF